KGDTVNYGLDGDVIYHEYTHGMVQGTAKLGEDFFDPNWFESAALNEAYADYYSSTFAGDPHSGEYAGESEQGLRNLDNKNRYPDDIDAIDEHMTGLIW